MADNRRVRMTKKLIKDAYLELLETNPSEKISVTDICTCHNPEYLFSHRASQGRRGNLGAFLMLK